MYKIITIFFFCIFSYVGILAQDFAPIGAKLTYEVAPMYSNIRTFVNYEIEKDTILLSTSVRRINIGSNSYYYTENCGYSTIWIYESNDTVYSYNSDRFDVLYNFAAEIGDTWNIVTRAFFDDEYNTIVKIIDKKDTLINGHTRKKFIYEYTYQNYKYFGEEMGDTITATATTTVIEGIGSLDAFFYIQDVSCFPVYSNIKYLRCYEDTTLGLVKFTTEDCFLSTISISEKMIEQFSLFPNPATDFIHIQLENTESIHYPITDITGKVVIQNTWNGNPISIENLNSGVYFITLSHKNEILGTQKFIKI